MHLLEFIRSIKVQLVSVSIAIFSLVFLTTLWVPESSMLKSKRQYHYKTVDSEASINGKSPVLFTKAFLTEFNGEGGKPIYLAILGKVYDVTKGYKHYGPNGAYHYFAGRDASIAFVTGEFEKYKDDEADDVLKLTSDNDVYSLAKWQQFYDSDYKYIGRVIGRFYDNRGEATEYHNLFKSRVEQIKSRKALEQEIKQKFPDCNVEWSPATGTHVWCDVQSGGHVRTWIGYPRKLYEIGGNTFRCACVHDNDLSNTDVMLKMYENCDERSHECFYDID